MSGTAEKRELRTRVAGEQNWRCCYCGNIMAADPGLPDSVTLERVIPGAQGGRYEYGNVVAACYGCNNERGSLDHVSLTSRRRRKRRGMRPDDAKELQDMLSAVPSERPHRTWSEEARATLADIWPRGRGK